MEPLKLVVRDPVHFTCRTCSISDERKFQDRPPTSSRGQAKGQGSILGGLGCNFAFSTAPLTPYLEAAPGQPEQTNFTELGRVRRSREAKRVLLVATAGVSK
jgi:hypothetical protein